MSKYLVYAEYFWLLRVEVQFGVIRRISDFHQPCTCCISSETANSRAKWTKIWASGVTVFGYIQPPLSNGLKVWEKCANDSKITLTCPKSKYHMYILTAPYRAHIFICFNQWSAIFKLQANSRQIDQVIPKWLSHIEGPKYPMYICIHDTPLRPKFSFVTLYDKLFLS